MPLLIFAAWRRTVPGILLGLLVAVAAPSLRAHTYYISQSGSGSMNASGIGNAAPVTFFNTAANWSTTAGTAGEISPGDTVYLEGTITSPLRVEKGGTSGNPITIKFDTGAIMASPVWPGGNGGPTYFGAISLYNISYVVIDGGATGTIGGPNGNASLANGIIENTDNGSSLDNQSLSTGVWIANSSYVTVQNLVIENLYVRTSTTDLHGSGYGTCVDVTDIGGSPTYGNDTVNNCLFHDAYVGASFGYNQCTNFTYSNSTAYNCNWGGICGDNNTGNTLTGVYIHDNNFHDFANWDDTTGGNNYHHNGFFTYASHSGSTATTVRYYRNQVGPNFGLHASSGLFIQSYVYDAEAFGNLFLENSNDSPNDGMIYFSPSATVTSTYGIYSNTFIGGGAGTGANFGPNSGNGSGGIQSVTIEDNLGTNCTFIAIYTDSTVSVTSNYNDGYNLINGEGYTASASASASFKTFSQWQGLGYDANSITANPNLNGSYVLPAGSPAEGAGLNLSSTLPLYSSDIDDTALPASGNWDLGAFQHQGGLTPTISWSAPAAITYGTGLSSTQLNATATDPNTSQPVSGTFVYTPAAGTVLNAGASQNLSVTFTPSNTSLYNTNGGSTTITVNAAAATFNALPTTFAYNGSAQGPTINPSPSGASYSTTGTTSATAAGNYSFTINATGNYTGSTPVNWSIGQATPTITWNQPAAINQGIALSSTQLDATATFNGSPLAGTLNYTPAGGTVLGAGANQSLSVTFTPTDTTDFAGASDGTTLTVNASGGGNNGGGGASLNQTIDFTPIPGPVIVGVPIMLSATASSGLPVTFSVLSGSATITSGDILTVTNMGSVIVEASQAGNSNYLSASATQSVSPVSTATGFGTLGGGSVLASSGQRFTDATGSGGSLAVDIDNMGGTGTLVGYIASIKAGFVLNFTLSNGSFSSPTSSIPASGSASQTLTISGTLSNGTLSGTIAPLGLNYSVTMDPGTGSDSSISGLYDAGSVYSVVGASGQVFVLVVTPGLVDGGTGTVNGNGTYSVTTSQGATVSGTVNAGISGSIGLPNGGGTVSYSGGAGSSAPTISPGSQNLNAGAKASWTVSASGATAYQWQLNGVNIPDATQSTYSISNVGAFQSGVYTAAVTTGSGTETSAPATLSVAVNAHLINLSGRGEVSSTSNLAVGFAVSGSSTKSVLVRGVGPTLSEFGVSGALTNPVLTLFDSKSVAIASDTGWGNATVAGTSTVQAVIESATAALFNQVFAFALPAGSADSALDAIVPAGTYSAQVSSANGGSGPGIAEIYDADTGTPTDHLENLSCLSFAGQGSQVLAAGFVVSGSTSQSVLVRGIGPALAAFGVSNAVSQPQLTIYDQSGAVIATDTGWSSGPTAGDSTVAAGLGTATAALMSQVGAFALTAGSADCAAVVTLPPGNYTAMVTGANGTTGTALIELYDLP